jgi:2-keto-3-deoxy-L-rhamnonate aldolase RhmA
MVAAAGGAGLHTIVRVQECRSKLIEAALDAGADGVLVPHVSSAAAAALAVGAARFAPEGRRGVNPYVRAARYGADPPAFLAQANEGAACIAMIEGPDGLEAAGAIVATAGLDAVFVGPFDLSAALGLTGEVDHPRVIEAVLRVHKLATASGVATGAFAPTPEAARGWLDRGLQLIALSVDTRLVLDGMRRAAAATRSVT